ncbi:MAG: hypothetical protein ACOC3I_02925, partial [Verrucomicrobiota bacterium]
GVTAALATATGASGGRAAEEAAWWAPVLAQLALLVLFIAGLARRHGMVSAGVAGLVLLTSPLLFHQFQPGVLSVTPWALALAALSLFAFLPAGAEGSLRHTFSPVSAVAAAAALWLEPAIGFPVVLLGSVVGGVAIFSRRSVHSPFIWSIIGAGLVVGAWLLDGLPWEVRTGELRYVHPLYAVAWLGLGAGLEQLERARARGVNLRRGALALGVAMAGLLPLGWVQVREGYAGWLYPGVALRRLSPLDEGLVFPHAGAWLGAASGWEIAFLLLLPLATAGLLAWVWWRRLEGVSRGGIVPLLSLALLLGLLVLMSLVRVRWGVVLGVLCLPACLWLLTALGARLRRPLAGAAVVYAGLSIAWQWGDDAGHFARPARGEGVPRPADLEALVHRGFAHWLAARTEAEGVEVLAPPELSDALRFHGARSALMSTAWEDYAGQIAASRLLSAPEASEAEAVLAAFGITHVVLASWDPVLPLLVRKPLEEEQDTLHDRLERWVLPPFLRPLPYHLPDEPAFAAEKLAVFEVTDLQDPALALARLAEYFVEMRRPEPAALVAQALAQNHPDDPNAWIARALVARQQGDGAGFRSLSARLAEATRDRQWWSTWDREVQRIAVLAAAANWDLVRRELAPLLSSASRESLLTLTPLQADQLRRLMHLLELSFNDPALHALLVELAAVYAP